ncbi:type VI secretion system baseplate subunit TssF [Xylophilus sp. Kf1]|nr:type VI secretion system baseplate subunit TssF [Xylophilus sp. Kf1]
MDPLLLDYFNRELAYLREAGGEFAAAHPKIARRLGMHGTEVDDPYVERLVESFAFMSARVQIKLDAEFPRFTERLLEVLYPNYRCPTPSMAVAQLHLRADTGDAMACYTVPRDTAFVARQAPGEVTACQFRSSQPVDLWPIEIVDAKLTATPPDLPGIARRLPPHVLLAGALRLRLRLTTTTGGFADLKGLDELPVYLGGSEQVASHLFELLHTSAVGSVTGVPGALARQSHLVVDRALVHEALEPGQGLLPLQWNTFHGHNLLHEFFTCPQRFWFFRLTGLRQGLALVEGREAEIVVLLSRPPGALQAQVDAAQFALFCTPVINLFRSDGVQVAVNPAQSEFHLVSHSQRPLDYEVFWVQALTGPADRGEKAPVFRPLYETRNEDEGNHGRYFSVRREARLPSDNERRYGTRMPYVGSEMFVSLVDQHEAPFAESLGSLAVTALLTNRDLPCLVPRDGLSDLTIAGAAPVARIGLIRAPSPPRPPFAQREVSWRLIRQLGFNHLPLLDLPQREGALALRDMLRLFVDPGDGAALRQIDSLIASSVKPVTRRLPGTGPLLYGRGVECTLTVDEAGFSGSSPYLFGLVLERYLARHVSINVFTETVLASAQRGTVARWSTRMGGRGVA